MAECQIRKEKFAAFSGIMTSKTGKNGEKSKIFQLFFVFNLKNGGYVCYIIYS